MTSRQQHQRAGWRRAIQ